MFGSYRTVGCARLSGNGTTDMLAIHEMPPPGGLMSQEESSRRAFIGLAGLAIGEVLATSDTQAQPTTGTLDNNAGTVSLPTLPAPPSTVVDLATRRDPLPSEFGRSPDEAAIWEAIKTSLDQV